MSLTNNSNSFTNNRSSIFETFHTPNFGDEEFDVSASSTSADTLRTYSHILQPSRTPFNANIVASNAAAAAAADDGNNEVQFSNSPDVEEENDVETMATLWMSCSPGRDSPVEEEEVEGEEEDEDEDDSLPLSKFQTTKGHKGDQKKKGSKGKDKPRKKKDPNAPKKSMSAYSLFFRDTQASIKTQNTAASFGEISRIVASMWDTLQPHEKEKYNSQAEKEKQVYLKALAEYQATLKTDNKPSTVVTKSKPTKAAPSVKRLYTEPDIDSDDSDYEPQQNKLSKQKPSVESDTDSDRDDSATKPSTVTQCARTHCHKPAVSDPRWDSDFCSEQCVVLHCRDVFSAWVASRQPAKVE